jgi:predicted DNA-binding transcriptional regulator YafY
LPVALSVPPVVEFYRVSLSSGEALATLAALRAFHALTQNSGVLTDVEPGVWQSAADRLQDELPDFVHVHAERLAASLAAALAEGVVGVEGLPAFDMSERGKPPYPVQRTRRILENAQLSGRPATIHYYVKSRDEWTTRRLDDLDVYEEDGSWYVSGHCGLRHEHRLFRLDHIGGVKLLGDDDLPDPFAEE